MGRSPTVRNSLNGILVTYIDPTIGGGASNAVSFRPRGGFLYSLTRRIGIANCKAIGLGGPLLSRHTGVIVGVCGNTRTRIKFAVPTVDVALRKVNNRGSHVDFGPIGHDVAIPTNSRATRQAVRVRTTSKDANASNGAFLCQVGRCFIPTTSCSMRNDPRLVTRLKIRERNSSGIICLPIPLADPGAVARFAPRAICACGVMLSSMRCSLVISVRP